jgi:hypothetical protein
MMERVGLLLACGICGLLVAEIARGESGQAERFMEDRFEAEVRPVLVQTCFPCHGGKKTSGGLKVHSREALLKGGDGGPSIVPGQPEQSLLVQALRHSDEALSMPPGKRLPDATVNAFADWIRAGAPWPSGTRARGPGREFQARRHWAFEPVRVVEPPPDPSGWATSPIDRFIAAGHRASGVRAVAEADRRVYIRRLTFDLTGLPPTPAETASYLKDDRPDADARLIERLLASPRYGERWGRFWMDVARYADTAGDNADYPVPEASDYRDYIIRAFNADKPFDVFVREQLAGDLIAARHPSASSSEQIVATGFLALSRRYATGPYELWHLTLEDAIDTTGRAFLGLTLRCARCHDHKYDPVTQKDYYALYGIFASTRFPYAGSEEFQSKKFPRSSFVPLLPPEQAGERMASHKARLKALEQQISDLEASLGEGDRPGATNATRDRLAALQAEHERLRRSEAPPDLPCAYAVSEGSMQSVPLQRGGDPGRPGPVVPRQVPPFEFLAMTPPARVPETSSGRRELAEAITRADHPLTPRVIANRVWQHHFGRGIVATPSNFGIRGEPPSHPELLDWLANRVVSNGWSLKDLHRQIVSSRTYRLASLDDASNEAVDPDNRQRWRFGRRRLDAESIRDAMLAVSGNLEERSGGRQPFPPIEEWEWTQHNAFKAVYPSHRRTVYLMTQRLLKHPFLAIFDGPDTNTSTDVRARSTVPLQALYLMNDPFVQEQAAALARRVLAREADDDERITYLFELAWNRRVSGEERSRFRRFLRDVRIEASKSTPPEGRSMEAWSSLSRIVLSANEFLYVD